MGLCGGKASTTPPPKPLIGPKEPKPERKKLNPADFIISQKTGEVVIKRQGTVDGQQFNIEDCKDCDIFLLDHLDSSFIDKCEGCRIFVGPTKSSVFIRDCTSCDFMIACQQFRTRDCKDCRFALMCTTQPSIETSTNMQFACFDFSYFTLRQQLGLADLKVYNNKWWQIHDFNKNLDKPNWSLFPQDSVRKMLRFEACAEAVTKDEMDMIRTVPLTLGGRPWPSKDTALVLFLQEAESHVEALITKTERTDGWYLIRGRHMRLDEDQIKILFAWAKEPKRPDKLKPKERVEVTGLQLCGEKMNAKLEATLSQEPDLAAGSKKIFLVPAGSLEDLAKRFFDDWKDEI